MKVILFDFDGVIADTFSFCYRIINSRDSITEEEYRARFEGNINNAPKKTSSNPTGPFDFFGQYTPELMRCQPNKEVADIIKELAHDHVLIIISSTISQPIADFLQRHGLKDSFKEILGNDVEKSKVKKIQDVLQRYSIKPEETIMVTDTLGDIKEAGECEVRCIAVTWGYHPAKTLQKGNPYKLVSNPKDLAKAISSME